MSASNSQPRVVLPDCVEGDKWEQTASFTRVSTDFTTVAITCKLRSVSDAGTVVHTFSGLTATFPDPTDLTAFTTTLTLSGTETDGLGTGQYWGDVVLSMTGFGPYTPVQFSFSITPRITA